MPRDPYEYFRIEAREILDGLGRGVLQLEREAAPEVTAGILRLAHTLKGAARVVKQAAIAESAHAIEGQLTDLREARGPLERTRIDRLLELVDAISGGLRALDPPAAAAPPAARAESLAELPPVPEGGVRFVRADGAELDAVVGGIGEVGQHLQALRRVLADVARARQLAELLAERIAPGVSADGARFRERSGARLRPLADELRDLTTRSDRRLRDGLDQAERELREARDAADKLRLVPAVDLFVTLERTARDAAASLGKKVAFEARGGDIRLEAQVLTVVQPALVQLIRNAVAHGIEGVAERSAAGKPPAGRVEIEAARRGSRVVFVCRDDGRGIDLPAVEAVARRQGVLLGQAPVGHEELVKLLLRGGLTTSGAVTEVAGRGIGLDVVRAVAVQLGGAVAMATAPGQGTTFELLVPLALSSFDALLVEVDGVAAAIPLEAVRRTVRLVGSDIARSASAETVVHDGRVIPFVPLARALRRRSAAAPDGPRSAVVVSAAAEPMAELAAFGVDRLLGTANLVARPLPRLAYADPVVAGAAVDGEGMPQLVLDPGELVAAARQAAPAPAIERPVVAPVLVIDDSLTTRGLEQSILQSAGYEVEVATSGEEAMEKARRRRYALFLVDVEMPGMDGFTFVAGTRADPTLRETPAILVTSRDAPEDRQRGRDAGAAGYIVKGDFDQAELLSLIRRLVR